jgi:biopolymer transport protein ExbD
MRTKKRGILAALSTSLIISTVSYSQEKSSFPAQNVIVDSFKIILTSDELSITFQNKPLPIKDIEQFDNYLKNNHQDLSQSQIFLESPEDIKYERMKRLMDILKTYKNTKVRSLSFNRRGK